MPKTRTKKFQLFVVKTYNVEDMIFDTKEAAEKDALEAIRLQRDQDIEFNDEAATYTYKIVEFED